MKAFDDSHDKIPEFQVFRQCTKRVMDITLFVSAVGTGDWLLHLTALKSFTKYFFAYDRPNYARMADPTAPSRNGSLAKVRPWNLWRLPQWKLGREQEPGHCILYIWSWQCSWASQSEDESVRWIGWDHFEPKRSSKVFLIAPELSQLSAQAKSIMAGVSFSGKRSHYYAVTSAVFSREEKSAEKLLTTMERFTNPIWPGKQRPRATHYSTW